MTASCGVLQVTSGQAVRALGRDSTMDDDAALIARSVAGDLAAYGLLVGRYQYDALRIAAAIAGPASAEDAAQDAFVRAFSALPRFDGSKPFRPWLMTIVANTSRNQRRAAQRWERTTTTGGRMHVTSAAKVSSAEDVAVQRAEDDDLFAAVAGLPDGQRSVIACRYLMDLTEDETAMVLGIPRGTVKSRLARGLSRLEQSLSQERRRGSGA